MIAKGFAFLTILAFANAGGVTYLSNPSIGAQSESTVRGFGGFSSVSQQSKAVDSPFSSVRKSDVRVTNDAVGVAYAAPVATYAAAPVAAPISYAAPAYAAPAYAAGPAYAQPAYAPYAAAPVVAKTVAAPVQYAQPAFAAPAYAAPAAVGYAAPAVAKIAQPGLLGVAYSAVSPAVATLNFNGYGISYGY